ncbi:MAG: hypothetical protein ACI9JN_001580 [Bacteroidia bacterium]|jgi:hypothetical protein
MKHLLTTLITTVLLATTLTISAKEDIENPNSQKGEKTTTKNSHMKFASDCEPASAQADLDINNVRARILNGGDMWTDLVSSHYEIPKVTNPNGAKKNSLFAGAIWIGGEDEGVLKVAAMTYRQKGSDFWPGPLDNVTGTTNKDRCEAYDNIHKVTRIEIEKHVTAWEDGTLTTVSDAIKNWPGNGKGVNDPTQLAPFYDQDSNGIYEPRKGDYPVLQTECRGKIIPKERNKPSDQPDQMLWFVYNDRGNEHSETGGQAHGLELQTTAFAYATNDEINNMTFYTTRIINHGSSLDNTYFGQWVDPDLGYYADDYVGCDIDLSLGFCYNGDDFDEGPLGYGYNPPAIGIDFLEGPKQDTVINGIDTTYELGMSNFISYYNDFTNFGNPEIPIHYYNYLRGYWKNGDCLTRDWSNGRTGSRCTDYMWPGTTDPTDPSDWSERTAGNTASDRRMLQSAGPFTLKQGAVNKLTIGVIWAKASSGGALASVELMKQSSRKAQDLFDNCFKILNGPEPPVVTTQELDKQVVLMFSDTKRIEAYKESTLMDRFPAEYKFQGYRIYQLKNSEVSISELENVNLAREVLSCDLNDSITRLVNRPYDETLGEPHKKVMIDGPNVGLQHSFSFTEDAFAVGNNKQLVNHSSYHYLVLSYAGLPGHRETEYLQGRVVERFTLTPHQSAPRQGGLIAHGNYGTGPELTRLEGQGNGGMNLELTEKSVELILADGFTEFPTYKKGRGPVNIKVVDPLKVPKGNYELVILEDLTGSSKYSRSEGVNPFVTNWILVNQLTQDTVFSEYTIDYENEQIITSTSTQNALLDWGLSVTITQPSGPGNQVIGNSNGFISYQIDWEDSNKQWLSAIRDIDNGTWHNWIRAGRNGVTTGTPDLSIHDFRNDAAQPIDNLEVYENIWDGRIAPYRLASKNIPQNASPQPALNYAKVQGIAFQGTQPPAHWSNLNNLSSVDLVFTKDESLWTQCLVLELGEESSQNEGGAMKFEIRKHNSINKYGTENTKEQGRTWFPGYAINVETGERLNIILGEDSYQKSNNGSDLKWNPTDESGTYSNGYAGFGGKHYIYIMDTDSSHLQSLYPSGPKYDGGKTYLDRLKNYSGEAYFRELNQQVLYHAMWTVPTFMASGFSMDTNKNGMPVPPTELSIKLRVKKPYRYYVTSDHKNNHNPRYSFTTDGIHTEKSTKVGKQALKTIRMVPNPYFGFSAYENNPTEKKVKITNLPEKCKITIYTIDGGLVRIINKDDMSTEAVWDITNNRGKFIASGTYLINIDAGKLGSRTIKWMGLLQ